MQMEYCLICLFSAFTLFNSELFHFSIYNSIKAVDGPSLEVFKAKFNGALSNLV